MAGIRAGGRPETWQSSKSSAGKGFARSGRTLVVIAHRISSALRGRRVLVMDGADVLVGTHEDLQQQSPLYRDLIGRWSGETTEALSGH